MNPPPSPGPAGAVRPTRRRLWQLPAELRALVVGLGLPPSTLRSTAERALARLHRVGVVLGGSDADVLASVLCDLGGRNAVAEAVQAQLVQRHAAVRARLARLGAPEPLREAWRAALAGGDVPGTAWALLTHALGASFDEGLLVDLRGWAFAQVRAQCEQGASEAGLRQAAQQARAEADALRLRLQQEQAASARDREAQARELARLRGECEALRQAVARSSPGAVTALAAVASRAEPRPADALAHLAPTGPAWRVVPVAAAAAQPAGAGREGADAVPARPGPGIQVATPPRLRGRRVLCVGGMPGALDRYRRLVETAGAEFDFHDGGLEQGLHRLDRQLGAADVVVCQAGCLNHEAYRRVKGHCRRADKTCLFVERPSLAHFARSLGLAPGGAA